MCIMNFARHRPLQTFHSGYATDNKKPDHPDFDLYMSCSRLFKQDAAMLLGQHPNSIVPGCEQY